jgi:hypothetical protein
MNCDAALRRYRQNRFTDNDVTHCTGLSVRGWRELIQARAVRTVTENRGRGRVRQCDATTLKRVAAVGALSQAGFSLAVSGQIACCFPLRTVLYEICDPAAILLQRAAELDPQTGLPPRLPKPRADWFDPERPAKAEPESDWWVQIFEGRFVGAVHDAKEPPTIFGDLRQDGANFVAWVPVRRRGQRLGRVIDEFVQVLPPTFLDFVADWENPTQWAKELKPLGFTYENHNTDDDPLCRAAEASTGSPLFTTTINITLAIRQALRRYLGIEPVAPRAEPGSAP